MRGRLNGRASALFLACCWLTAGCGPGEALDRSDNVVARAGDRELTVDRLGEIIAQGSYVPLEPDVVERVAGLWVDYTLVADRFAAGDSLIDSTTVLQVMWDDVERAIISHYHDDIVSERVLVDAARIDSAYAAGEHRLVYHILVRVGPDADAAEREALRTKAARLQALAASGSAGWARANRESEDSASREMNGRFGLIARGETLPQFDRAAFSLAPGEISGVVESEIGYHILRRPELEEVRGELMTDLHGLLVSRMNQELVAEVERRWEVEVDASAVDITRRVATDPGAGDGARRVLGRYRGGRFRVSDLRRWLKALPVEYTAQVRDLDDEQLTKFLRGLMRNQVLATEAREAGYELTPEDYAMLRETMAQDVAQLRAALGVDTLFRSGAPPEERSAVAAAAVDTYLSAITNDLALLVPVPPFLAERLRNEGEWGISDEAVGRALARGARLRYLMEATTRVPGTDSSQSEEDRDER